MKKKLSSLFYLPIFISLGVALGLLMDNLAVGIVIGVAVGVSLDSANNAKKQSSTNKENIHSNFN